MVVPASDGYNWLSLLLVGVPSTILAAITLGVVLLDRVRSRASKDGQDAADIQALEGRVSGLHESVATQSAALQQHLVDCAKNQGRIEMAQKSVDDTLARLERGVAGLQRTVANWMRDEEKASR